MALLGSEVADAEMFRLSSPATTVRRFLILRVEVFLRPLEYHLPVPSLALVAHLQMACAPILAVVVVGGRMVESVPPQ